MVKRGRTDSGVLHDTRRCRYCLKTCGTRRVLELHEESCDRLPDGPVVFQNERIAVFAVDGRDPCHRVAAKRMVELGMHLLEHKHPLEDVHLFMYYALYIKCADSGRCEFAGYFSREHPAQSKCCLACIIVLEEYRGLGLGRFLAAVSLALSRAGGSATPERPLSVPGQHLFASLWQRLVLEHFSRSHCTSVQECSKATGIAVDDVLRALHTLRIIGITPRLAPLHPMAFVASARNEASEATLLWP